MDWHGIWYWIVENGDNLLDLIASSARGAPLWVIVAIAGCLALEGIRRFIQVARLRRHVRKFEQAEIEHRIGVVEKPRWERKRNRETKIGGRIYHPVQRDPGGIWLQVAATEDEVQSHVNPFSDEQKLISHSVGFHSSQHRREAAMEAALGVVFVVFGAFVSLAYYVLNLEY